LDPATVLREVADPQAVVASPEDDIIAITTRMADFNLLSLPVLDAAGRMLGIVTVDDALEAAIQRDWFERKTAH
ncbi:MAG TPA: CBS domain-containing protein, partial [Rhizomicrobium sp.]|nr:CBS domain-containing protein [Rhizomicrobium sp.]